MAEIVGENLTISPIGDRYTAAITSGKSQHEVVQILQQLSAEQYINRKIFSTRFLSADLQIQLKMRANLSRLQLRNSERLKNDDDRLTATLGIYLLGNSEDFLNAGISGDNFLQIMIDHKGVYELLRVAPDLREFMVRELEKGECQFNLDQLLSMETDKRWGQIGKPDESAKKIYECALFFAMRKFLME